MARRYGRKGGDLIRSLVTGGHGFIASHLARALVERGDRVTVIDKAGPEPGRSGLELQGVADQVELIDLDLAQPGGAAELMVGEAPFDSIFHLAAQTLVGPAMSEPVATFEANVAATWQLLEACRHSDIGALIVASSDKAYGPSPQLPYREGQALLPASPYEASKAAAEMIVRAYRHSYRLPVTITRFANVYGGGDLNFSRLIPELMAAEVAGRRPEIRSDGSPERDYLYIDDAVAAYLAVEKLAGEGRDGGVPAVFNAGSGRPRSVRELIEDLGRALGRDIEVEYRGRGVPAGEIDRQWVDSARLRDQAGWCPEVELQEGLGRTHSWYRTHSELVAAT